MNRIPQNTLLQVVTRCSELVSALLVNAWIARRWGSHAFGEIGFFIGLMGICSFLFDLGLKFMLIRAISRDGRQAPHLIVNGIAAMLPLSLLGGAVLIGTGAAMTGMAAVPVLALASLQLVLGALGELLRASFCAYERMEFETASVVLERACWIAAGYVLAGMPPSLGAFFAAGALCKLVSLLASALLFCLFVLPRADRAVLDRGVQLDLLRQALPFALTLAFATVYLGVDIVLLSAWVGPAEAGQYRAASGVVFPIAMLAVAFNNALYPRMSAAAVSAPHTVGPYSRTSSRLMLAVAIPIGLFVALFAPQIVSFLYGDAYGAAVVLLRLLAVSIPLRFLNNSLGTVLSASDQHWERMLYSGMAAAFNVAANAVLIPRWGGLGACATMIATDLLIVGLLVLRIRVRYGQGACEAAVALRSFAVSGAILVPLAWAAVPLPVAAAVAAVAYPLVLLRTRILSAADLSLLLRRSGG